MRPLLAVLVAALSALAVEGGETVTILRDRWGVPHVFGESEAGAAYGHGFAQAEDRLHDLLANYAMARGESARLHGPERIEQDLVARMARHSALARSRYGELAPRTRRVIEYFVAGVRAFEREHPEAVPEWAVPPEPHDVVALYRAVAWQWPWGQARGDLGGQGSQITDGRGSNQWVVAPSRSAESAAIALIDPHLAWEPETRFYEAHVHGGGLDVFGFSILGTPLPALGHTDTFALALTTGGPDCADVYEVQLDPENPRRYRWDGSFRPIEVETVAIEVRTQDGPRVERREIERTHHGPVLKREGDRVWAVRTAYDEEIGLVEQWHRMLRARDLGDFRDALRMNQALPQNLMYADVRGNTYYVRAGRVPVRPPGFRWDRPVADGTGASEWRGVHRLEELVQLLNPAGGYMQNCNVAPDAMLRVSPLAAGAYPDYVFNATPGRSNERGRRAIELLEAASPLTVAEALRIAVDTHVEGAERWQSAVASAFGDRGPEDARHAAVRLLLGWDRRLDADSRAGVLYRFFMQEVRREGSGVDVAGIEAGATPDETQRAALLATLARAAKEVEARYGRIDPTWGDVHRGRRGDRSWPLAGLRGDGISTLRSIRYGPPDARGVHAAVGGQLCPTVVLLREGRVTSWSAPPFGQSDHPGSEHFTDQGERLFAEGRLKPTWYRREELRPHVSSRRTLRVPRSP
jgi:acyl-homoserine lactone acylase PvdQ